MSPFFMKEVKIMDFEIRCAKRSDISVIVELVYQLAIYEKKSPDKIGINAQKVEDYCFGERKCFDCCIVWVKEKPVGYALYSFRFSGWAGKPVLYLEDVSSQSGGVGPWPMSRWRFAGFRLRPPKNTPHNHDPQA